MMCRKTGRSAFTLSGFSCDAIINFLKGLVYYKLNSMSAKNKRCRCGSGKKYKNCCAEKDSKPSHSVIIADKLENANAFYNAGKMDEAQSLFEEIIKLNSNNKKATYLLGLIAIKKREYTKAEALLRKVIDLEPNVPVYYSNLGAVLQEDNRPEEAVVILTKAISMKPDYADAYLNRACALTIMGNIDDAIADYESALKINPGAKQARANMAYTMNFSPSLSEEELFNIHKAHALTIESKNRKTTFTNTPVSNRKLKVGYLSSDFRRHSVSYFTAPVLEHHDKNNFEVFAYYNHEITDSVTEHLIDVCDQWRNIGFLSDQAVARQIKKDEIDILIDLNGYTGNNRLGVLALKPAPIQCEWLGYPNTTGLDSMDYWICDETVNPPGLTDKFYSESLLRLPGCFICFKKPEYAPEPVAPPSVKNGYVTFGSFNNYAKVSREMLQLWANILDAVADSRLILKSACLGNQAQKRLLIDFFKSRGIQEKRLRLEGYESSRVKHIEMYSEMDIALDTFPYNGTTTTCEAMWMGVPTISLAGNSHRSRVGKSLLECVGLGELVAGSPDEYINIATDLAGDAQRLSEYRSRLRETVDQSALTDGVQFTASLESAYRSIWKKWCSK